MQYSTSLLVATLLQVVIPCCLQAQSASNEYALRNFTREYMAAYNRQDIDALVAMHTSDAVVIVGGRDTIQGGDALAKRYEDRFVRYDGTLLMRHVDLNWSEEQQAWVARGFFEGFGSSYVYDIPYHGRTAYAHTMAEEDGHWKIARSVVSPLVRTLVYQEVADVAEWSSVLRGFLHHSGVLTHEIGELPNAPGTAYALLQWPDLESAQAFFGREGWQNTLELLSDAPLQLPVVLFLGEQ